MKKSKQLSPAEQTAAIVRLGAAGKGYRDIAKETGATFYRVQKILGAAPATSAMTAPIESISVGKRVRLEFGDVASLARSIDANGLLHPIVVRARDLHSNTYELIAGERRLKAWQLTRFRDDPIPIRIIDIASIMRGEWAENRERKDFTPSETVAIKRALDIEFDLKGEAQKRKKSGKKSDAAQTGRATEIVGAYAGKSWRTIEKAEAVVTAAEQDPERFGRLREDMDRTGKVDGPHKRLAIMQQTDAMKSKPATLPSRGPYACGVIDFPWPHEPGMSQEDIDAAGRSLRPYAAMAIVTGMAFMREKIRPLIAADCTVWFWTTNFHMPYAFALLAELGFVQHSTIGTWLKQRMGRGQILRDKTEHCIIAKRGKPLINLTNQTTEWSGWKQPTKNSRKPDEFYRMVEELCPAERYADIFSFGDRGEKWDCFGDQAERMAPAAMAEAAE